MGKVVKEEIGDVEMKNYENDDVITAAIACGDCSLCPHWFIDKGNGFEGCNILEEDLRPCVKF